MIEKPEFFEEVPRQDRSIPLVIFDEIHKYRKWKNYLKGTYDKFSGRYHFLVLGSGRSTFFKKAAILWPMVALELLRSVSNWNDLGLGYFDLHYLRNKEKEEVDFVISQKNNPILLIEAKLTDDQVSKNLAKFQSVLQVPSIQLVNQPGICKVTSNNKQQILVASATRWLPLLP